MLRGIAVRFLLESTDTIGTNQQQHDDDRRTFRMRLRRGIQWSGGAIAGAFAAVLMTGGAADAATAAGSAAGTAVSNAGPLGPVGLAWSLLPAVIVGLLASVAGRIAAQRRVRRSGLVWPR